MASTRQSPAAAKPISPLYTNSSQQIQAPRNMLQPQNPRVRANRMPLQRKDDSRPFLLKSCFSHLAVAKHTTHVFPPPKCTVHLWLWGDERVLRCYTRFVGDAKHIPYGNHHVSGSHTQQEISFMFLHKRKVNSVALCPPSSSNTIA